jgi:hypothetical protein
MPLAGGFAVMRNTILEHGSKGQPHFLRSTLARSRCHMPTSDIRLRGLTPPARLQVAASPSGFERQMQADSHIPGETVRG